MAKDPKTLDLLKRLNGDRSVQFVIVDAKQAEDKKVMEGPPGADYRSVLRVTEPQFFDEGEKKPGTFRFRVVASYFVSRNEGAQRFDIPKLPLPLSDNWLVLAMDDYVSRHAPGWTVSDATFPYRKPNEKPPSTIEEQRKELDRLAEECAREARDHYAAQKKSE
jgi:hypothetical protein